MIRHTCSTITLTAISAVTLFSSAAPTLAQDAQTRKPNVIVIVADDLGNNDVTFQGGKGLLTPNLDALAAAGTRFSCPVCAPTRAGLLTGRYQQRFGFYENPAPGQQELFGLPVEEKTMADAMKKAGYRTGIVGKWHLGNQPQYRPLQRGFDEFYGFLGGAHRYIKLNDTTGINAIRRGDEPITESAYLTDAFNREAVAFIERNRDQPFFLYLPYNAVHTPMQTAAKYLDRVKDEPNETRRQMIAMLAAIDDGVGQIDATLRKHGIDEDTLVFFFSDNGGPPTNGTSNAPYRGYKRDTLEGGVRVPFVIRWPGKIPAGKVDDRQVIQLDVMPTALAAAGADLPSTKLDGKNLLPYLTGKETGPIHEALFWSFGERKAVREGDWKLQWSGDGPRNLYHLPTDPGEAKNVADANPEIAKRLSDRFDAWARELPKPKWVGNIETDDDEETAASRPNRRRNARPATQAAE
jgi:arylsulfatase A-like enzyme